VTSALKVAIRPGRRLVAEVGDPACGHLDATLSADVGRGVAAHEFETNPAGGPLDSNPFGVLAGPGGRLVTDALFRIAANGTVETLAKFSFAAQSHSGRTTDGRSRPDHRGPGPAFSTIG